MEYGIRVRIGMVRYELRLGGRIVDKLSQPVSNPISIGTRTPIGRRGWTELGTGPPVELTLQ